MTRETKLGIAVAGTFLTLVGVWAGIKFFRGEPSASTEQAAATETEIKPDAAADPKETTAAAPGPRSQAGSASPGRPPSSA